jgi:hypothetical protein
MGHFLKDREAQRAAKPRVKFNLASVKEQTPRELV